MSSTKTETNATSETQSAQIATLAKRPVFHTYVQKRHDDDEHAFNAREVGWYILLREAGAEKTAPGMPFILLGIEWDLAERKTVARGIPVPADAPAYPDPDAMTAAWVEEHAVSLDAADWDVYIARERTYSGASADNTARSQLRRKYLAAGGTPGGWKAESARVEKSVAQLKAFTESFCAAHGKPAAERKNPNQRSGMSMDAFRAKAKPLTMPTAPSADAARGAREMAETAETA